MRQDNCTEIGDRSRNSILLTASKKALFVLKVGYKSVHSDIKICYYIIFWSFHLHFKRWLCFLKTVFSLPHAVTPYCFPLESSYRLTILLSPRILNPLFVLNKVCSVPEKEINKPALWSIWLIYHCEGRLLLFSNTVLKEKVTGSAALGKECHQKRRKTPRMLLEVEAALKLKSALIHAWCCKGQLTSSERLLRKTEPWAGFANQYALAENYTYFSQMKQLLRDPNP